MTHDQVLLEACERLSHVPYWHAQTVLGVDDGGFASMYESDVRNYGGRFSNEIGGPLLEQVREAVGPELFSASAQLLFADSILGSVDARLRDDASPEELSKAAEQVALAVIGHLKAAFPEAPASVIDERKHEIHDFAVAYMKAEIDFAAQYGSAPAC